MPSAEKRGTKFWIAYRDASGKRVRRAATSARTIGEAREEAILEEGREKRIARGEESPPPAPTKFSAVAKRYLKSIEALPSYKHTEGRIRLHLLPTLGERLITTISPADLNDLLTEKAHQGYSLQQRKHIRNILIAIFSYAIESMGVLRMPADGKTAAQKSKKVEPPKTKPVVIRPEWVVHLFAAVPRWWTNLFATAAYVALRKSELLGLNVEDVDLSARFITAQRSYDVPYPKDREHRRVPIPEALVPYLEDQIRRVNGAGVLFPMPPSKRYKRGHGTRAKANLALHEMLPKALVKVGIVQRYDHHHARCEIVIPAADSVPRPCPKCDEPLVVTGVPVDHVFKDLRSTCASSMHKKTGNYKLVQQLLGHSDDRTTERYVEESSDEERLAVADQLHYGDVPERPSRTAADNSGQQSATIQPHPPGSDPTRGDVSPGNPEETQMDTQRAMQESNLRPLAPEANGLQQACSESNSLEGLEADKVTSEGLQGPQKDGFRPPSATIQPQLPELLTVGDVAAYWRVSNATVYGMVARGTLPAIRIEGSNALRFRVEDVQSLERRVLPLAEHAPRMLRALKAIAPFLPTSDEGPQRKASEHARAAALVHKLIAEVDS